MKKQLAFILISFCLLLLFACENDIYPDESSLQNTSETELSEKPDAYYATDDITGVLIPEEYSSLPPIADDSFNMDDIFGDNYSFVSGAPPTVTDISFVDFTDFIIETSFDGFNFSDISDISDMLGIWISPTVSSETP